MQTLNSLLFHHFPKNKDYLNTHTLKKKHKEKNKKKNNLRFTTVQLSLMLPNDANHVLILKPYVQKQNLMERMVGTRSYICRWFCGFLGDQNKSASAKRIILSYFACSRNDPIVAIKSTEHHLGPWKSNKWSILKQSSSLKRGDEWKI